ncbi:MAG: hypothetical protein KDA24_20395 [Deltaproteobacteria bacterium]|nr:hypothetical protein [Deltaproteobacteria bacterium]
MRILLGFALLLSGCALPATPSFVEWLPTHPIVVAHRGGASVGPENTIRAIQRAQEPSMEAEVMEIDLHSSADDVLVVIHDKTVDRTTGVGQGCDIAQDTTAETFGDIKVHDLTLAELQELDAGACYTTEDGSRPYAGTGITIPTLRETLVTFPTQRFMLEIKQKDPSVVPALLELVGELDAFDRSCFLAFDEGVTQELARTAPEGTCISMPASGIRCWSTDGLFPFGGGGCPTYDVMWMPHTSSGLNLKTERIVSNIQDAGMPVFMWTINDEETMQAALDAGVDGIITDRPDLARSLIGRPGVGAQENE